MSLFHRLFGPDLTKEDATQELKEARAFHVKAIERIDRQLEELKKED